MVILGISSADISKYHFISRNIVRRPFLLFGAPVAQLVKRWPTALAVSSSSSARG